MKYNSLLKYSKIVIGLILLAGLAFFFYINKGKKIEERLAGVICAKMVNDFIDKDFTVKKVTFNQDYKFNQARVDLLTKFSNGKNTTSSCYYKKRYSNNKVSLLKAELRDKKGKLKVLNNLQIKYKR